MSKEQKFGNNTMVGGTRPLPAAPSPLSSTRAYCHRPMRLALFREGLAKDEVGNIILPSQVAF